MAGTRVSANRWGVGRDGHAGDVQASLRHGYGVVIDPGPQGCARLSPETWRAEDNTGGGDKLPPLMISKLGQPIRAGRCQLPYLLLEGCPGVPFPRAPTCLAPAE